MHKLIVLDPGHGGRDAGAVNGARQEKDDALALALRVRRHLSGRDCTVLLTRGEDVYVSLAQRTAMANSAGADLFVSLHRNSFTGSSANGVEIWVYTTAGMVDEAAAGAVLAQLAEVGVQSNRGVKKGNYHVLRESAMASMLVELGFLSNDLDNRLFDQHLEDYAAAIAQGVCTALGIESPQEIPGDIQEAPSPVQPLYRVQVGAFSHKSNAEAFLHTVRQMGLEAFLVEPGTAREEA